MEAIAELPNVQCNPRNFNYAQWLFDRTVVCGHKRRIFIVVCAIPLVSKLGRCGGEFLCPIGNMGALLRKMGIQIQGKAQSPRQGTLGVSFRECEMSESPRFRAAFAYQNDVLALPVADIDAASHWYSENFGMAEVERRQEPSPTVILDRDGTRIGFSRNGGDASQDGAAVLVAGIVDIKNELEAKGVKIGNWRVDERNGQRFQVFFVVAPDGLCYYFHEPL